ncbi:FBP domain-containing protein [Nocardia halotolerans]|uniref:FBP domain-containing protein n=1 Tax=Nocardia halotolerans TaxID=1755878 RepID=A0ABV8VAW3_9NOCA
MEPITERDIRSSFVNCSKGDAKRLSVPRDLGKRHWEDLDFLGWTDPSCAGRCYIAVPRDGELLGIALRHEAGSGKPQMCALCLTTHSGGGVALMTAKKAGESGRRGNTVGSYLCADLACSLYARNKKRPAMGSRYREDLTEEAKVRRLLGNLYAFIDRLYT